MLIVTIRSAVRAGAALAVWLALVSPPGFAQDDGVTRVLLLHSFDDAAAPYDTPTETFQIEVQRRWGAPIGMDELDIDARWGESADREQPLVELLLGRYAQAPPDLVVAVGPPAVHFWLRHRDAVSASTPFVAMARIGAFDRADLRPGDAGIVSRYSFAGAVDGILDILPRTRHVVFVLGASDSERALAAQARREMRAFADRLTFELTNDMTIAELTARLGRLGDDAAVYYAIFNVDAAGIVLRRFSGLELVRAASPVPVFGPFEDQLGRGIVGGRLIESELIGIRIADAAMEMLRGVRGEPRWEDMELSAPQYDWRELEAFGIDAASLPPGSEIAFVPPGFWDTYGGWVLLVAAVVGLQSLLLLRLQVHHRRRRAAEAESSDLSRKLITAHEDERRRIARELHDDLSQRLARLSIDIGAVERAASADIVHDTARSIRNELQRVGEDLHDMSYRLHPSLVDDLGIVTALKAECRRVRQRADVTITERIEELGTPLTGDTALCVYRLVQEALNNAVRHAGAASIEVALRETGRTLELTVRDDGRGFDTAAAGARAGLGLASMRERVKAANGRLEIRSRPGSGTTIEVGMPITARSDA